MPFVQGIMVNFTYKGSVFGESFSEIIMEQ